MNSEHKDTETQFDGPALNPASGPLMDEDERQDSAIAFPGVASEDGLPLLEDVIEPDDPIFSAWNAQQPRIRAKVAYAAPRPSQSSPDLERDLLAYKLRTDLAVGLEQLVRTAIERSVRDLEKALHTELLESLGSRIDAALSRLEDDRSP